jgi:hypothetical protein
MTNLGGNRSREAMDLSGVYSSSSSSSSSPPPPGRYDDKIYAHLKCVAVLSPHQCLVEVVDMDRLLAHCSEEELVLVELEEEPTTLRRERTREEEIAHKIGLKVISHHSEDQTEEDLDLFELDRVEESPSEEKISTARERALSLLTRDCVFATTAMVGVCAMVGVVLANDHALTVARLSVLILAVTLTIFCCVLSELTKN